MLGLMQDQPLLISSLIEFAERHHSDAEIVSRRVEGDIHRSTWSTVASRARQVANALDGEKLLFSDRVATLAWNGYRHLELYYGVSGTGRVLHTINPRLHPDQIAWIANHAEDQILCFDLSFLPLVQAVHGKCRTVRKWIALCDADKLPVDSGIPNLVSYEAWMGDHAAKGLEWDYVFLIGVTQGVLPDRRAQTKEQQDEERRMLYTGITRARVKLWLTHSPVKVYGVRQVYDQPSKFLDTDEVRAAIRTVPPS